MMNYQIMIENTVKGLYEITKVNATSRHCTIPYWRVKARFGVDLNDKKVRDDVWELSYSNNEFCDLIQTMDFDNDQKEVTVMLWTSNNKKKYTLENYEEFCENAFACPPFDEFDNGNIDESGWHKEHDIHISSGKYEIELNYEDDVTEGIKHFLKEKYEVDYGDGSVVATTGNTIGSEYRDATWKDILRFAVLDGWYEDSHCLEAEIDKCIHKFSMDRLKEVMKKIENQTSMNDELEVNFFKLDTTDLWKIFDLEERIQAFKEILCSNVEISELMDKDGKHYDQTVIMDHSIIPSGDLVGWHYGVDFDKDSEDNQDYINDYIERMTR